MGHLSIPRALRDSGSRLGDQQREISRDSWSDSQELAPSLESLICVLGDHERLATLLWAVTLAGEQEFVGPTGLSLQA